MGLDMIPIGKPKPGKESEFKSVFNQLINFKEVRLSWLDRLRGKKVQRLEDLQAYWLDLQISAFETLGAPMVGRDEAANDWAKACYQKSDKSKGESEFLSNLKGHYVTELAQDSDGIVRYISTIYDGNVFRGQFLVSCITLIGEDLVNEAWEHKFAEDALDYARRLNEAADPIAVANRMEYLKVQRELPEVFDENNIESQLHIIYSLSRWLNFYGEKGHGYEADF